MTFTASPTKVVYEEDPLRIGELLGSEGYRSARRFPDPPLHSAVFTCDALMYLGRAQCDAAFLHARQSPDGSERLVLIAAQGGAYDLGSSRWISFTQTIGIPASRAPGNRMTFKSLTPLSIRLWGDDHFRLFAGQANVSDPSHFTIRYELNDAPGMIDGWLKDGDIIELHIRDGPAATNAMHRGF